MEKQDVIKQMWCQLISVQDFDKLKLDDNGWSNWRCRQLIESHLWNNLSDKLKPGTPKMSSGYDLLYRPKSLKGIETNNGWNKIITNEDLPKADGDYTFMRDGRIITIWFELGTAFSKQYTHWREVIQIDLPLF